MRFQIAIYRVASSQSEVFSITPGNGCGRMQKKTEKRGRKSIPVPIPAKLYLKIKKRIKSTEFRSVQDYVVYVLEEVISSLEAEEEVKAFSDEDEKKIKDRLRALGYLD